MKIHDFLLEAYKFVCKNSILRYRSTPVHIWTQYGALDFHTGENGFHIVYRVQDSPKPNASASWYFNVYKTVDLPLDTQMKTYRVNLKRFESLRQGGTRTRKLCHITTTDGVRRLLSSRINAFGAIKGDKVIVRCGDESCLAVVGDIYVEGTWMYAQLDLVVE